LEGCGGVEVDSVCDESDILRTSINDGVRVKGNAATKSGDISIGGDGNGGWSYAVAHHKVAGNGRHQVVQLDIASESDRVGNFCVGDQGESVLFRIIKKDRCPGTSRPSV